MTGSTHSRLYSFAATNHGAASVELAAGAMVLVMVAALCFDLYSGVQARAAVLRMAVTMADYVSRDAAPSGDDLSAVGAFLYTHELRVPAHLVFVLTALRKTGGNPLAPIEVMWADDSIRVGDETETEALAAECSRHVTDGGNGRLPQSFQSAMESGEMVIVAEVCARLLREGSIVGRFIDAHIYRFHAVPPRDPNAPPVSPVFSSAKQTRAFALCRPYGFQSDDTSPSPMFEPRA